MKIELGIFTLLGAFIGAAATLAASWINNQFQLRREREKWEKDKLHEIYSNCIYNLMRYLQGFEEKETKGVYFAESYKWLSLLLAYHPNKSTEAYKSFRYKTIEFSTRGGELIGWDKVEALRDEVLEMASKDRRLHS